MTDHTQLRKLAIGVKDADIDFFTYADYRDAINAFIAAANPQAVIELLDEIERLRKDYNDLIFQVSQKFKGETRH